MLLMLTINNTFSRRKRYRIYLRLYLPRPLYLTSPRPRVPASLPTRSQVPTHASQCRRPSFIHRRGWPTLKEVIDRFLKGSVHKLKENAKAVPKNSKETSEDNTDVEMDLHILRVYSNVTQTCSSVHSRDKRLIAA